MIRWLTNPTSFRARVFWWLIPIFVMLFAVLGWSTTAHAQNEAAQPQAEPRNLIDNSFNRPAIFIAALDKKFKAAIKMLAKHNLKGQKAFSNQDDFSKIVNAKPL